MISKRYMLIGLFMMVLAMAFWGCATSQQQAKWAQHEDQRAGLKDYPYYPYSVSAEKGMTYEQYLKELQAREKAAKEAEERARQALAAKEEAERKAREAVCPPLNAKPGECYARVFIPPQYRTVTEKVLVRQAYERIETIPAQYEVVEQKVLVREASVRYEEVPPEYGWVEEKVLVEPAHTVWKKGRGLIEKIDHATGEIMCLVEVPAKYETIRKQVVVKPATVRKVEIPAEYETIKVTKMVSPPQEKRIQIPAEYATVTRTEKVSEGRIECKKVLCETNVSSDLIMKLQQALNQAGFYHGPIDGIYGTQTQAAVTAYQRTKGLAQGELTYETFESLGIKID